MTKRKTTSRPKPPVDRAAERLRQFRESRLPQREDDRSQTDEDQLAGVAQEILKEVEKRKKPKRSGKK